MRKIVKEVDPRYLHSKADRYESIEYKNCPIRHVTAKIDEQKTETTKQKIVELVNKLNK